MKGIQVKGVRTEELTFVNRLGQNGKINISNRYSYNVRYAKENLCRGEFTAEVKDKESEEHFSIKITVVALFSFDEAMAKEDVHRSSYEAIFPYVRSAVTNLTANAGIPPIYIPYVDISGESVYRIELPTKE